MTSIHRAGLAARMGKKHMFLAGGPGGGKSMFADFMLAGEVHDPFKLQMNQLTPEQAIVGGQVLEAAKRGQFKVSIKGSLADHVVAVVDEAEKGNPMVWAAFLSLLNEGVVLAGGQIFEAKTETLFATSNAHFAQILKQFEENGVETTAPALLNRFQFKALVANKLPAEDEAAIVKHKLKKRVLQELSLYDPTILDDALFVRPRPIDWQNLRHLSRVLFRASPEFEAAYIGFSKDFGREMDKEVRDSATRMREQAEDELFRTEPAAEHSTRFVTQVPPAVLDLACLDFLLSPLGNDVQRNTLRPIELGVLSLWRAYAMETTLGMGETRLITPLTHAAKATGKGKQKVAPYRVAFGWTPEAAEARTPREEKMLNDQAKERETFNEAFVRVLKGHQKSLEDRVRFVQKGPASLEETAEFELALEASRR
jgi:hypothetical protein